MTVSKTPTGGNNAAGEGEASPLHPLSQRHGITTHYPVDKGGVRTVPEESLRLILESLGVDPSFMPDDIPVHPHVPDDIACFIPDWLKEGRAWGFSCQLYELRSARNWGIGDFRDLRDLVRLMGAEGADFLGVNPLHALFLAEPSRCSPFSPSNRRFLNPLYIAVDDVPGAPAPPKGALDAMRSGRMVDYEEVARLKVSTLRAAFNREPFSSSAYARSGFDDFCHRSGPILRQHALFECLSLAMVERGHQAGWTSWPAPMRDRRSAEVTRFAEANKHDIDFHVWLQWIANLQLDAVQAEAVRSDMRIGLYLDLAVGEAPDGSSTWSDPDMTLRDVVLGAPPDVFATEGQSWGLAAPSPRALAGRGYAPFREMIAAQMDHAGALRIDHAMALWQLFLVPEGNSPLSGAHLRYPFADLLRVLAEESQRHGTVVIGEDLGFVPEGFREAMAEAAILSYRILYFEQMDGKFLPPTDYPTVALACLSTHDLPTLASWWRADDIVLRRDHGLVDDASSAEQLSLRGRERQAFVDALAADGLLTGAVASDARDLPSAILAAAHRFIARTPSLLTGVRLADLIGPVEPTNLPGTVDAYPNWRLRCPVTLEDLPSHPALRTVSQAMREERPRRQAN